MEKRSACGIHIKAIILFVGLVAACGDLCSMHRQVRCDTSRRQDSVQRLRIPSSDYFFYVAYKSLRQQFYPIISKEWHGDSIKNFLKAVYPKYDGTFNGFFLAHTPEALGAASSLYLLLAACAVEVFPLPRHSLELHTVANDLCSDLLAIFSNDFSGRFAVWFNELFVDKDRTIAFFDDWIAKASAPDDQGALALDRETGDLFRRSIVILCNTKEMDMVRVAGRYTAGGCLRAMVARHSVFKRFFMTGECGVNMLDVLTKYHVPVMKKRIAQEAVVSSFGRLFCQQERSMFRDGLDALRTLEPRCCAYRMFADEEERLQQTILLEEHERLAFLASCDVKKCGYGASGLLGALMGAGHPVVADDVFAHELFSLTQVPEDDLLCQPILRDCGFRESYAQLFDLFVSTFNDVMAEKESLLSASPHRNLPVIIYEQFIRQHRDAIFAVGGEALLEKLQTAFTHQIN